MPRIGRHLTSGPGWVAAALAGVALLVTGCGSSASDGADTSEARATPMQITAQQPALRMEGLALRGTPVNMRFARDSDRLDMSLAQDGLTVWSVTGGVPVLFERDRPTCRYPTISRALFDDIASQVLWSASPPADFPDSGTWGFLGTRADADRGAYGRRSFDYDSGGRVSLGLDAKDRPVSATAPRGPFTLSFARYSIATVGDAAGLPDCP